MTDMLTIQTDVPPVVELDSEARAAYVRFSNERVATTRLIANEECLVTVDLDAGGQPVGIELVGVSEFGVRPLLRAARATVPEGLMEQVRYIPAALQLAD